MAFLQGIEQVEDGRASPAPSRGLGFRVWGLGFRV